MRKVPFLSQCARRDGTHVRVEGTNQEVLKEELFVCSSAEIKDQTLLPFTAAADIFSHKDAFTAFCVYFPRLR